MDMELSTFVVRVNDRICKYIIYIYIFKIYVTCTYVYPAHNKNTRYSVYIYIQIFHPE